MGERIKDLGIINIGNDSVVVELNKGYTKGQKYDIHLQTAHAQVCMSDDEFIKFAAAVRAAKKELERMKSNV